jgi:hypothetical protein
MEPRYQNRAPDFRYYLPDNFGPLYCGCNVLDVPGIATQQSPGGTHRTGHEVSMSKEHAKPEQESAKKHGDMLEAAMHEVDTHTLEKQHPEQHADAVPPPDNGGHAHSAAAHLKVGSAEHTKPEGNLRQGSHPNALREPPMVVQRVGKQHRG